MGRVYKNYTKDLKEQACKLVVEKNIPVRIVDFAYTSEVQFSTRVLAGLRLPKHRFLNTFLSSEAVLYGRKGGGIIFN